MKKPGPSDPAAIIVIVLTIGLFALALFLKGFTHDLLLEGGVFLVSAKLILMAKKNTETEDRMEQRLMEIKNLLDEQRVQRTRSPGAGA
jgi:predicted tellurium resistance membrane protein TerC